MVSIANTFKILVCQLNEAILMQIQCVLHSSSCVNFRYNSTKPQSHQACDQITAYLRPKNGPIVERTYDWSQRPYDWSQGSWLIARGKSVAARSWSCSKPSHTGLTTRLRPTCDRKILEWWATRRKNVRLVAAEVVRLVAEVVGDRKGGNQSQQGRWSCSKLVVPPNDRWYHQSVAH